MLGTLRWVSEWERLRPREEGASNPSWDIFWEPVATLGSVLEGPSG